MNKTFLFLLLFVFQQPVIAQWSVQTSGTVQNLTALHFVSSSIGYVVGASGTILKTTNGGSNWQLLTPSPTSNNLRAVFFIDSSTGWISGEGPVLYKTTDGGANWQSQTSNSDSSIDGLWFISSSTGFYINDLTIYKTINGGTNWSSVFYYGDGRYHFEDIEFISDNVGFLLTEGSWIVRTTAGGGSGTWDWYGYDGIHQYPEAMAVANTTLYQIGSGAATYRKVSKSTNSGYSWTNITMQSSVPAVDFWGLDCTSSGDGLLAVGGSGTIAVSTDGGANWTPETSNTSNTLQDVQLIGETLAFAVGNSGTILTRDSALPVELISFNGTVDGNIVTLKWQTATEINNYGFEVQRKNENSDWIKIGFVEGHGNSNSPKNYSFNDHPQGGSIFSYRLKQIDFDGSFEYSKVVEVNLELPVEIVLEQNHPNPFNPKTKIRYQIPTNGNIKLVVYDAIGREVAELENGFKPVGSYEVVFDASQLGSTIYFYQLRTEKTILTKKMLLIK